MIHHVGDAQADFGSADFHESSKHHNGKYFVMSFPYSNGGYLQLHYGENMECFLESTEAIFEHIGASHLKSGLITQRPSLQKS